LRLQFIHENRQRWPITTMCRALDVTPAAYYKAANRPPSQNQTKQEAIIEEIKRIHEHPKKACYGSPRIHREIIKGDLQCSKNTVAKLMRQKGIRAVIAQKFRVTTTDSKHDGPIAPNRLNQQFATLRLNQVWLTDFTYIATKEGFTYLCTILDLHSRKIVGHQTSRTIDAQLAIDALRQAVALRNPPQGLILHSDRGSQFASLAFRQTLEKHHMLQSMSRKGNCYDNAPMESFFKSLKVEEVYQQQKFSTHEQATRCVIDYIERFYNCERLHSALDYQSPVEFENALRAEQQMAP